MSVLRMIAELGRPASLIIFLYRSQNNVIFLMNIRACSYFPICIYKILTPSLRRPPHLMTIFGTDLYVIALVQLMFLNHIVSLIYPYRQTFARSLSNIALEPCVNHCTFD